MIIHVDGYGHFFSNKKPRRPIMGYSRLAGYLASYWLAFGWLAIIYLAMSLCHV